MARDCAGPSSCCAARGSRTWISSSHSRTVAWTFRTPSASTVFDYGQLTGGRPNFIYRQHLLVGALCDALVADGADLRFASAVTAVRQDADGAVVTLADGGEVACEAVVGCEGSHSVVATAMTGLRTNEENLPARVIAVIADAPPVEAHTIYGLHPRGFAGQMRRGPDQTRYYVEAPDTDTAADWPDDRIRKELALRLDISGRLDGVAFSEPIVVDLKVRVHEPMQDGRLFLAGDAAHLITAAAGKGMNLAIQDSVERPPGSRTASARTGTTPACRSTRPPGCPRSGAPRRCSGTCACSYPPSAAAPSLRAWCPAGSRTASGRAGRRRCSATRCWHAGSPTPTPGSTRRPDRVECSPEPAGGEARYRPAPGATGPNIPPGGGRLPRRGDDLGQPDRGGLRLLGRRRLDHHPHELLGARRAQQHATGVAELDLGVATASRTGRRTRPPPVLVGHADVLPAPAAARVTTAASSASDWPVSAMRAISRSAVSRPSPVVACAA